MGHFNADHAWNHENGGLETVSEENRRNAEESGEVLNDFYRESYDPEISGIDTLDMSQATFIGEGIIPLQTTAINNNNDKPLNSKSLKKFSLLHTFIPSFFFVILAMSISAIFILESESELFAPIRNWPEMNSLRFQYYEPLKEFIASKIGNIFWNDNWIALISHDFYFIFVCCPFFWWWSFDVLSL